MTIFSTHRSSDFINVKHRSGTSIFKGIILKYMYIYNEINEMVEHVT